jgi:hypothetical protein
MRALAAIALIALLAACAHASPAQAPKATPADRVDYSCRVDADCVVKNVGNCCGQFPACVNRDSPTFPDQVRAECAKNQMAGVCGFPVIQGCTCVEGRCSNVLEGSAR